MPAKISLNAINMQSNNGDKVDRGEIFFGEKIDCLSR